MSSPDRVIISKRIPEGVEGEVFVIRSLLEHPPRYDCISIVDEKNVFNPFYGEIHNKETYLKHREKWIEAILMHFDKLVKDHVLDDNSN